ncbi:MAG: hypothetical protein ACJ71K_01145 [Nitrososphaeraceae archaeon]
MSRFANPQVLLEHAMHFINRRMDSLKNNVSHCVKTEPYAPYPALIYCFSNIDLLGALYLGKAGRKNTSTSQQSKNYMKRFMGYTEGQSALLQCIFRHKLVHLAEPLLSVIEYKSRRIAWQYNYYNMVNHLIFVPATTTNNNIQIAPNWNIEFDEIFEISILGLAEDVVKSVYKDGGYLQMLEKDNSLQAHFEEAVEDIHSMTHIKTKPDGTLKC